jgi:hypothetical protein
VVNWRLYEQEVRLEQGLDRYHPGPEPQIQRFLHPGEKSLKMELKSLVALAK